MGWPAIGPVERNDFPEGPKVVVRNFAGMALFIGQYARFAEQAVFRKGARSGLTAVPGGRGNS